MWNRGHSGQHLLQVVAGRFSPPLLLPHQHRRCRRWTIFDPRVCGSLLQARYADGPLIAVGARLPSEMAAHALLSGLSESAHDCANRHGQSGTVHLGGGRRVGQRTEWNSPPVRRVPERTRRSGPGLLSGHRDIGSGACRPGPGLKHRMRILCWARPATT